MNERSNINASNMIAYRQAQEKIVEGNVFVLQIIEGRGLQFVRVQVPAAGCLFSTSRSNTFGFEASKIAGPSSLATWLINQNPINQNQLFFPNKKEPRRKKKNLQDQWIGSSSWSSWVFFHRKRKSCFVQKQRDLALKDAGDHHSI